MEKPNTSTSPIDVIEIVLDVYKVIKANFQKSVIITAITAVVTVLILISTPRYYTSHVKLVPEYASKKDGGLNSLGSAAAMFGINLGNTTNYDAIAPTFYPEIIASNDFLIPLMQAEVETKDGNFKGTYIKYLTEQQKTPWWNKAIGFVFSIFKSNDETPSHEGPKFDPFMLTKDEKQILDAISSMIKCSVDSKTFTIEISTTTQDPLVAAMMANVVKEQLQDVVTEYRTGKVKKDYEYAIKFCDSAHDDYITAQEAYAEYADKHQGISRQAYRIEQERLQGEMQLAYSMYNAACQQKIMAASKLQEETPVFTEIQKASVPIYPSGTRRLYVLIAMMILSFSTYNGICFLIYNRKKEKVNAE